MNDNCISNQESHHNDLTILASLFQKITVDIKQTIYPCEIIEVEPNVYFAKATHFDSSPFFQRVYKTKENEFSFTKPQ
jgi:hypothetical protein